VTELDGTISRETFTILNNAGTYTEDQQYNIYTFSSIYSWLFHLYKNKTTIELSSTAGIVVYMCKLKIKICLCCNRVGVLWCLISECCHSNHGLILKIAILKRI
jgi:hypothetical protein